eukprot:TRINITY_DN8988_c0_g1_i3.p1 TRINITY_DN8988_c0_g1~~TRINITY_DN8988_c0_g1_i3.p1  ORF type:complete len:120 (+),score=49.94 TRINITY_DN8988_c0_g1_i3:63-422(+)
MSEAVLNYVEGYQERGICFLWFFFFFFFKQKTAYEMQRGLVGSEMCIRDRVSTQSTWGTEAYQSRIDELIKEQTDLKNQLDENEEKVADLEAKINQIPEVKEMSPEQVEILRNLSLIHI